MAQAFADILYSLGNCLSCFSSSPTLKINGRSLKILRLLGEGGFSYVYLVQDTATGELFALKKIRCPFGAESVAQAMKEVEAYSLFSHCPGIIHAIDHAVAADRGGDQQTVYILLPYYRRGNLQDLINANLVNGDRFPEPRLLELFLGVCRALRHMHHYTPPSAAAAAMRMPAADDAVDANVELAKGRPAPPRRGRRAAAAAADEDDEAEQQRPLMQQHDEDAAAAAAAGVRSYAHRDIKPGNIMISDDGTTPILMDLGSVAASPVTITTRSQAIAVQDTAAEHSTMPYRAPELFDVQTGATIGGAADVWSLGCTLFACLVGRSPFEMRSDESGGSLSLCVLGGDWRFPDEGASAAAAAPPPDARISAPVRDLVRRCLRVDPAERPGIDELIALGEGVMEEMRGGGGGAQAQISSAFFSFSSAKEEGTRRGPFGKGHIC